MMKRLLCVVPLLLVGCVFYDKPVAWTPAREPLTPERIVELKQEGRPDSDIRRILQHHGVAYKINADDLIMLKKAGAGDALLSAVTTAPVRTPLEAKPIYERRPAGYYPYTYPYPAAWIGLAGLGFYYGAGWGHYYYGCR